MCTDLATIYVQSEAASLQLQPYFAWVGLHKAALLNRWTWSDGQNLDLTRLPVGGTTLLGEACAYVNYFDKK